VPQTVEKPLAKFAHLLNIGDFTPEEQGAIAAKAAELMANGKTQDQAVAIAVSACAPGKARTQAVLPGGAYTFAQNADGTFDIMDVPIMGPIPEGAHGNAVGIDRAWMQAAVDRAKVRLREDTYLPPLHERHHPNDRSTRAGFFLPRYVGTMPYDGQVLDVVFADLKHVPQETLDRIQAGELPYRSIEVNDLDRAPEIDSLALLPDEVPFFRFPLLTLGRKIAAADLPANAVTRLEDVPAAVASFRADAGHGAALFRLQENKAMTMEERMAALEDKVDKFLSAQAQDEDEDTGTQAADGEDEDAGAKAQDEDEGHGAKAQDDGDEDKAPDDDANAQDDDAPAEEPEEKAGDDEGDDDDKGAKAADTDTAALQGRVTALEAKDADRDQKDQVKAMVDTAMEALKGHVQGADLRDKLTLFAGKGKDALDAFVDSYASAAPKEPGPDTDSALDGMATSTASVPDAILKLKAKGPEQYELGVKLNAQYQALKMGNTGFTLTLEQYLEANGL